METEKTNVPPAQPSNEELVAFEKFRREYEQYDVSDVEEGATAHPLPNSTSLPAEAMPSLFHPITLRSKAPFQPISTEALPLKPDIRNPTPQNNRVSPRESEVLAIITREEISKQLHPLMESLNLLKREMTSRMETNIAHQNQILIILYHSKAFKKVLNAPSHKFNGKNAAEYAAWKKDLKSEIADLLLLPLKSYKFWRAAQI